MNLHRTLLVIVAVICSFAFGGGRSYGGEVPTLATSPWHLVCLIKMEQKAPVPFIVKAPDRARSAIDPVIFPKAPVPCGYHPQPAHC